MHHAEAPSDTTRRNYTIRLTRALAAHATANPEVDVCMGMYTISLHAQGYADEMDEGERALFRTLTRLVIETV